MPLLVANIPWSPSSDPNADPEGRVAHKLGLKRSTIVRVDLLKRSVDGRRRPPRWFANYRVEVSVSEEDILARELHGVRLFTARDEERWDSQRGLEPPRAAWPSGVRPIVVGAGPAGLFAALRLGEAGAPALLLERGGPVDERHQAVRRFWRYGTLDPEVNVVFGEGGAGTFSDGKIYTRRRDGDLGAVFRRLVEVGADPSILEEGWAHLGTDRIREMLPRLRERIAQSGVEVRFHARVDDFLVESGCCVGVRLAGGAVVRGGPVIVATGHSARDTWEALLRAGAAAQARPIHIGARIEHPQRLVDEGRYGGERGDLPPASYRLISRPRDARAAHTFCMCPGGTVVPATNHVERVVVNGMSFSKRAAWWANSAVVVEVGPDDYPGTDPLAGVRFQDQIEARAFEIAGGDYRAPAQLAVDLLQGYAGRSLPRVSYPRGVNSVDLREVLPPPIIEGMCAALVHFNKRIAGFSGAEGVLIAPETRTTSPIRFLRGRDRVSTTVDDLLPVGEGAGHAGGIASAALDGYRAANGLIERFCPRLSE